MNRKACAILLVLLPLTTGAARIATQVTLDRQGQGSVIIDIEAELDEIESMTSVVGPGPGEKLLVQQLAASPHELKALLEEQGFSSVTVKQSVKKSLQSTRVTARINDVRALCGTGGELKFTETPEGLFELNGSLGGSLAGKRRDLSYLRVLEVRLKIKFPGTVRQKDNAAKVSHSGKAVTYAWTGDKLLGGTTPVHVRVVPDIEGTPYFWLALILGVTGLVILGAFLVLRYGREALKPRPDK